MNDTDDLMRFDFVGRREVIEEAMAPDQFTFAPKGRWARLQRWAWQFLERSGAVKNGIRKKIKFERVTIDRREFVRRLIEQRRYLFDSYGEAPARVLVGAEDFRELMGGKQLIEARIDLCMEYHRSGTLVGLQVSIIPWMRGMLVMP